MMECQSHELPISDSDIELMMSFVVVDACVGGGVAKFDRLVDCFGMNAGGGGGGG